MPIKNLASIIFVLVNYWFSYSCMVLAYVHHINICFLIWLKNEWYWFIIVYVAYSIPFNNICAFMFPLGELWILWIILIHRNPDFLIFCIDVYVYIWLARTCCHTFMFWKISSYIHLCTDKNISFPTVYSGLLYVISNSNYGGLKKSISYYRSRSGGLPGRFRYLFVLCNFFETVKKPSINLAANFKPPYLDNSET